MIERLIDSSQGLHDRALSLMGFAGTFLRAELVGLDIGDLDERKGLVATFTGPANREKQGRGVGIPYGLFPRRRLRCLGKLAWLRVPMAQAARNPTLALPNRAHKLEILTYFRKKKNLSETPDGARRICPRPAGSAQGPHRSGGVKAWP